MMQVAVRRIRALCPNAEIHMFTTDAVRLARYCPGVRPVEANVRTAIQSGRLEWGLRRRSPGWVLSRLDRWRSRKRQGPLAGFVGECSLVAVCGMGGLTDAFQRHAWMVLELIGMAQDFGVPTALLSQGIGPIRLPWLWSQAAAVLPRVELLALREQRAGVALARALGVSASKLAVTGDDAIELAYEMRPGRLGDALGINLRVADYANCDQSTLAAVRTVLDAVLQRTGARVEPFPISLRPEESDVATLRQLRGAELEAGTVDSPEAVSERIGRCRVVLTGSYHGAVLALAQGVPVVAIAGSQYYIDKFEGLASMFGAGCSVIRTDADWPVRLKEQLLRHWNTADGFRSPLLEAARHQIASGKSAYERVVAQRKRPDR